jgi:hypothetical protein
VSDLKEQKAQALHDIAAEFGAAPDADPNTPIPNPHRGLLAATVEIDKDTLAQAREQGKRTNSLVPVFKAMFNQVEAEAEQATPKKGKPIGEVVAKLSPEQKQAIREAIDKGEDMPSPDVDEIIANDADVQAAYAWLDEEAALEAGGGGWD